MLEREGMLEVGIQHAMSKDNIRSISGESPPGGKSAVLPQSVNHDAVKSMAVVSQPWQQFGVEPILGICGAESVNWKSDIAQIGC